MIASNFIALEKVSIIIREFSYFLPPCSLIECQNEDKDPNIINNQKVMTNIWSRFVYRCGE